eukprot:241378_1
MAVMASSNRHQTSNSMELSNLSLTHLSNEENITIAIERDGEISPNPALTAKSYKHHNHHHHHKHKKKHRKKSKKHQKNKISKIGSFSPISQIEIYDIICDDDIESKKELELTNGVSNKYSEHNKIMKEENNFNFHILRKTKRPFYILIFISILYISLLIINFISILKYFLFNGLTASILSVTSLIPIFLCFKYFENNLIFQYEIIYKKIMETYSLQKQLQLKIDLNLHQKKYIDDLKQLISEQEIQIDKLSITKLINNDLNTNFKCLNLLHGFRKGQMEIQIEYANINELINMFSIVVSCITLLPFGQTNYRKKLKKILEKKIEQNKYLKMHFYFFL